MRKLLLAISALLCLMLVTTATASAAGKTATCKISDTLGIYNDPSTTGVTTCSFSIVLTYDAADKWFYDFGNGRIVLSPSITSVGDLDGTTLTTCRSQIRASGVFDQDPESVSGDNGSILVIRQCSGYFYNGGRTTLLNRRVGPNDPRYTGTGWAYETWETQIWIQSHFGNLVARSQHP